VHNTTDKCSRRVTRRALDPWMIRVARTAKTGRINITHVVIGIIQTGRAMADSRKPFECVCRLSVRPKFVCLVTDYSE
jgi:hypothetical protein